jgi:PAS domain S-box-containing protein
MMDSEITHFMKAKEAAMQRPMRIAIIGGGRRCKAMLEMIDAKRFPHLHAEIVAVADPKDEAVGIRLAREKQIYTTRDYRDFYKIKDIDLVIELTGQEHLLEDFLQHYPARVRVLEGAISRLFGDIIRFREEYLLRERQLELIESIIESMFLSIRDSVLIIRPDFKIEDANQAFLQSVALSREDVIGKPCYEIIHRSSHPCTDEGLRCPLCESVQTSGAIHTIHEHADADNQVRYCEITIVPLKDRDGKVEVMVETIHDITDELEKRLEVKTRAIKRDLARLVHEDKMIALGKLVASAVHEINNPLSGIHALARLMHQEIDSENLDEETIKRFKYYMHLIDTESARCSSIVSNLLSFSRQQRMERKTFQINDVVQKVVLLSKHRMDIDKIALHLDLAPDLPPITGDPGQIQQCILNLIFNSMEAMPNGGAITVVTRLDASRGELRLEVEDTGVGIPSDMMSQIFEPFFSTKSKEKGVGLGLSVAYGIIKEHGGNIYAKNKVGKGSHFIIRLPVGHGTA